MTEFSPPPQPRSPEQSPRTPTQAFKNFINRHGTKLANIGGAFALVAGTLDLYGAFQTSNLKEALFRIATGTLSNVIGGTTIVASGISADRERQANEQTIKTQQQVIDTLQKGNNPPQT